MPDDLTGQSIRQTESSMSDIIDEPLQPAPPPAPAGRKPWPTPVRRVVIVLLLLGAVAFLAFATRRGVSGVDAPASDRAVVRQVPGPGDRVLSQTEVGAELKPGYDGRLLINGIEVPEAQMSGALDPTSPDARTFGVRPNNRNQVFFKPGPGKVVDKFPGREVSISVRFWREADGPSRSRMITWQFSIT